MNVALMKITEALAVDFDDLPPTTVIRAVTDCADEFADHDPLFVGQAARARLVAVRTIEAGKRGGSDRETSLAEAESGEEADLVVRIEVAAHESDRPLGQDDIDRILGVSGRADDAEPTRLLSE